MKLSDIKGVFNTHALRVKSAEQLAEGFIKVELESGGLEWLPGEHGIFTLPGKTFAGRKWRAFSIASVPDEGVVRIGTRAGNPLSGFKQTLAQMKPGDTVTLRGPFGWYKLPDDSSPVVLIAGGTGITAARAVLTQALKQESRMIHLVHAASASHLYKDELSKWRNKKLDMHFTHESEVTESILDDLAREYGNKAYYFVSGPPKMNSAYIKRLKSKGIAKKHIIVDPYFGY